jgi:WhiB family redox-sensing transcriptional regulator
MVSGVDRREASCADEEVPTALFFSERPVDIQAAKDVCAGCVVIVECLHGAAQRREPWGVWGGELFVNGVTVAHKRGRGRPRKTPLLAVSA